MKPPPRKGKSSEPNLHDVGFQPLILSKVSGISTVILVGVEEHFPVFNGSSGVCVNSPILGSNGGNSCNFYWGGYLKVKIDGTPKGRLVKGPYKPIGRDCAIYFSTTVILHIYIHFAARSKNASMLLRRRRPPRQRYQRSSPEKHGVLVMEVAQFNPMDSILQHGKQPAPQLGKHY